MIAAHTNFSFTLSSFFALKQPKHILLYWSSVFVHFELNLVLPVYQVVIKRGWRVNHQLDPLAVRDCSLPATTTAPHPLFFCDTVACPQKQRRIPAVSALGAAGVRTCRALAFKLSPGGSPTATNFRLVPTTTLYVRKRDALILSRER